MSLGKSIVKFVEKPQGPEKRIKCTVAEVRLLTHCRSTVTVNSRNPEMMYTKTTHGLYIAFVYCWLHSVLWHGTRLISRTSYMDHIQLFQCIFTCTYRTWLHQARTQLVREIMKLSWMLMTHDFASDTICMYMLSHYDSRPMLTGCFQNKCLFDTVTGCKCHTQHLGLFSLGIGIKVGHLGAYLLRSVLNLYLALNFKECVDVHALSQHAFAM